MDTLLMVKNLKTCLIQHKAVLPVVDEVSFSIKTNSVFGLVGESGCGKTLTALSLGRLLPEKNWKIIAEQIIFDRQNLNSLNDKEMSSIRGKKMSYIFQEPATSLNPVLRVKEQIEEVVRLHRKDVVTVARKEFVIQQFKSVGIEPADEKIKFYPHQLSGGEKQRVMIAMAMVTQPKLLIADEPTTALDVTIQAQILKLINELRQKSGLSILLISHDMGVVGEMADYLAVMYTGQIIEFAPTPTIINNPKHPYTQGLLDCLPERHTDKTHPLKVIPGRVPQATNLPAGCRFHPRCPKVFKRCYTDKPPIFYLTENQEVRCWLYSGSKI